MNASCFINSISVICFVCTRNSGFVYFVWRKMFLPLLSSFLFYSDEWLVSSTLAIFLVELWAISVVNGLLRYTHLCDHFWIHSVYKRCVYSCKVSWQSTMKTCLLYCVCLGLNLSQLCWQRMIDYEAQADPVLYTLPQNAAKQFRHSIKTCWPVNRK